MTKHKAIEQERRDFSARLLSAQEEERRRLAREIHDDFCQRLAGLRGKLRTLARRTEDQETGHLLEDLGAGLTHLSRDIQTLSHRLHSSVLDLLGLVPSLDALCAEFGDEHGIQVQLEHAAVPPEMPGDLALSRFRIVQEAIHNAVKHSGASTVAVRLAGEAGAIALSIADNGRGLDPEAIPRD